MFSAGWRVIMRTSIIVALILAALGSVAVAQKKPDVDRMGENIANQLKTRLPGWTYKRLEPFGGSTTIVSQTWSTTNRIVKVTVAIRESVEDAKKEVRSFLEFSKDPEELTGFGDEAYAPERNGSSVVLRRGRFVIYISTVAYVDSDPDARTLTRAEMAAREKAEVNRIGREFARQLSSIELQ
jgi:hypothetical protein